MSMKSSEFIHGWLLHSRPYRDSSLLLDFFSAEQGRLSAIARGVRSAKSGVASQRRALLQPFIPVQFVLSGRGDLRILAQIEAVGAGKLLQGERLLSALYINELLSKLLPAHEPEAALYGEYGKLLQALAGAAELEPLLRNFELLLLECLGYGLQFDHDIQTGAALTASQAYLVHPEGGFVLDASVDSSKGYSGQALLDIASRDFSAPETRRVAKRLLRQALQQHLGSRELVSRSLFAKPSKLPPTSTPG